MKNLTVTEAYALISDHMDEGYNRASRDMDSYGETSGEPVDVQVAVEILWSAGMEGNAGIGTFENLELITEILGFHGGARAHQCIFPFRMKIGQ